MHVVFPRDAVGCGEGCFAPFIWGEYNPSLIPLWLYRIPLSCTPLCRAIVRSWVLFEHVETVSERRRSPRCVCRTLISLPAVSRGSSSGLALPEVFICGCLSVGIIAVGKGVLTFELPEGGGNVEDGCRGAEL